MPCMQLVYMRAYREVPVVPAAPGEGKLWLAGIRCWLTYGERDACTQRSDSTKPGEVSVGSETSDEHTRRV